MEDDDEIKGNDNSYDFGARMYDPRVGRWMSTDALESVYPGWSTYNFGLCNPIFFIDPDGNTVIPSSSFNKSVYKPVFDKLTANSVYNKFIKPFQKNDQVNYTLEDHRFSGEEENQKRSARTQPVSFQNPSAETWTNNRQDVFTTKELGSDFTRSEISLARTLIHESIHAYVFNQYANDQADFADAYTNAHEVLATDYRDQLISGLKEYAQNNGIEGLTDQNFEDLSWVGLQETKAFQKKFDTDEKVKDWYERVTKLEYVKKATKDGE